MAAASSAPNPDVSGASCVTMHLPVFLTELNTVSCEWQYGTVQLMGKLYTVRFKGSSGCSIKWVVL